MLCTPYVILYKGNFLQQKQAKRSNKYYKMSQNLLGAVCNGNPIPAECVPILFKLNGNHCEYVGYHLFSINNEIGITYIIY